MGQKKIMINGMLFSFVVSVFMLIMTNKTTCKRHITLYVKELDGIFVFVRSYSAGGIVFKVKGNSSEFSASFIRDKDNGQIPLKNLIKNAEFPIKVFKKEYSDTMFVLVDGVRHYYTIYECCRFPDAE